MSNDQNIIDPAYNKTTLFCIESRLSKSSSFQYNIGMLVYDLNSTHIRITSCFDKLDTVARPCLDDFATVGCVMQQAWRIAELEKRIQIESAKNKFQISANDLMNNVQPPKAAYHYSKAMYGFSYNGLSDMDGLVNLVEVFWSCSEC